MPPKTQKLEKPAIKKRHPNYGGARDGAGRPAFEPTDAERKQVEALSGYGIPQDQIAALIRDGISTDTLRAHFGTELIKGKSKANAQIGQTLFQKAISGDTTAAIWWSKTQMKWAEVQRHELSGTPGGAPIQTEDTSFQKFLEVMKNAELRKRSGD